MVFLIQVQNLLIHTHTHTHTHTHKSGTTYSIHILRNITVIKAVALEVRLDQNFTNGYHLTCEVLELHVVLLPAWYVCIKQAKSNCRNTVYLP